MNTRIGLEEEEEYSRRAMASLPTRNKNKLTLMIPFL